MLHCCKWLLGFRQGSEEKLSALLQVPELLPGTGCAWGVCPGCNTAAAGAASCTEPAQPLLCMPLVSAWGSISAEPYLVKILHPSSSPLQQGRSCSPCFSLQPCPVPTSAYPKLIPGLRIHPLPAGATPSPGEEGLWSPCIMAEHKVR